MTVGRGRGKAAEVRYADSDSDDSALLNAKVDDSDNDSSNDAEPEMEKAAGSDYDSDKDPAWRPKGSKAAKGGRVSHVTVYRWCTIMSIQIWWAEGARTNNCVSSVLSYDQPLA